MIYVTEFNPTHPNKEILADSSDSGFATLADVEQVMGVGKWLTKSNQMMIYPGLAFSTFPIALPFRIRIPMI